MKKTFYLIVILFLGFACNTKPDNQINIGILMPLTGELANFGQTVVDGFNLGLNENLKKELNVKIIVEDSKGQPKEAIAAFNKLSSADEVVFVVGALTSGATLAIAPEANRKGILLISPTASNPALSNAGPYFYRVYPSDLNDAKIASEYCFEEFGAQNASIVYLNNDYSLGLKDEFTKQFEMLGGKINLSFAYDAGATDFRTIIMRLKSKQDDVVYIIGHPLSIGSFLKQSKEYNYNVQFFSNVAAEDKDFLKIAKEASNNLYFTAPAFDPNSKDQKIADFVNQFQRHYNYKADIHAVKGYDIARLLQRCITEGNRTAIEIKKYIDSVSVFESVSGEYKFLPNGDVEEIVAIKRYESTNIVIEKTINPK